MFKDSIDGIVSIFLSVLAGFIWLIRLEFRTAASEAALRQLQSEHRALESKIIDKLYVIEKSLSKIEGRLSINIHEES